MNELSLFSGAGGGLLGTKLLGWRHIGYVEYNDYCQRVIAQRIKDGCLDNAPIFGDVRTFLSEGYAASYTGMVDVITAGFPCQPFSVAGKQRGEDDERNMWPTTIDIIRTVRPRYCLLENVPGLLALPYVRRIFGDLAEAGYDARWCVLGADDCGAPHRRKRLWIKAENVAYANSAQSQGKRMEGGIYAEHTNANGGSKDGVSIKDVADTNSFRPQGSWWAIEPCYTTEEELGEINRTFDGDRWSIKSPICRVANGVADSVDRLKATGNGQVPIVAATAWRILSGDTA